MNTCPTIIHEGNPQQQNRTLPRLHEYNFCMWNNRCSLKIRDILQPMGLFPILPKRTGLNIPHHRSFIPRLEITPTQLTFNIQLTTSKTSHKNNLRRPHAPMNQGLLDTGIFRRAKKRKTANQDAKTTLPRPEQRYRF